MSTSSDAAESPASHKRVLSIEEALDFALQRHRQGHLDDARQIYQAVLDRRPDDPVALHFLGVLMHQSGDSERAIELIRRAIGQQPDNPGVHNNLGNVLLESGRVDEAIEAYRRCLDLAPDFVETHNNLGTIYRKRGDLADAEAAYLHAIELRPDFAGAYCNMANLRVDQGRTAEAAYYGCHAITLDPRHAASRKILAYAYFKLGEMDKAIAVYRDWLAEEPDNPIARHHLAACTGENVPLRADDAYVEASFDAFASSFDANLELLNYRAPELVGQAVSRVHARPAKQLRILDAGCGTGLCGPHLAPYAASLVGVDLSGQMLDRAAARRLYDELVKAELTAYLSAAAVFDLVVSADTLCYFGDLAAVMQAVHAALGKGGVLIFTVEEATDAEAGYRINPHGRYSHTLRYVEDVLAFAGFGAVEHERVILRNEAGRPVAGLTIIAHKQGGV
ncbi:MAG: tetratricopeptide repeat protein [Gallionellaceae bacterium]|nr:tetratricopeptide repeat protein [Gallionellaceae bacterium]MDD5367219.1 tetratricopeptide repeat protein [Gallionellaceae bacterium]